MTFTVLIKSWADHFGMTVKGFMQSTGYGEQTFYNYRNRPNAKPRESTLQNMALAYDMTVEQFVVGPQGQATVTKQRRSL